MTIAVDFDGTCVTHEYPEIGKDIGAVLVLKELVKNGHDLVLNTMRYDNPSKGVHTLSDAVNWFRERDIPLVGWNFNPPGRRWSESPKIEAQIYIDDAGLGIPLIYSLDGHTRPYVDWAMVRKLLVFRGIIE